MKRGDKIKVLQMEDHNGMDTQASRMNGNIYTVDFIDDVGQIHVQESGLGIIPEIDKFIVIEQEYSSIQDYKNEILKIYDIISEYIKDNEYISNNDGLYLTEDNNIILIPFKMIPKGGEGIFVPIKTLIRKTTEGLTPNVDTIEDLVDRYTFVR
jgi:hypothetical protein